MRFSDRLGATVDEGGARFRVWAPQRSRVTVVVEGGAEVTLAKDEGGFFGGFAAGVGAGARYRFALDGEGPFPDPASRFQPEGVHGPSEVIDPASFAWSDTAWTGRPLEGLVLYELHVGTFTPDGTFAAATQRLRHVRDLGAGAIELMPVGDFAGRWNWGYDGVAPFAPARAYGRPDDLRRLVDRAHGLGLAVHLDVVYNHFGPDGAYQGAFSPRFFTDRHRTPWGAAINLDGPGSGAVRAHFVENALRWLDEYHVDGLRLDATHALRDASPRHFLAELAAIVRERSGGKAVLVAEDHRNLAHMVKPEAEGGWGLAGLWSDDFHHQLRRRLGGDADGYYRDFTGTTADIAETIGGGWFFRGQHSIHARGPRGSDPAGVPPQRFVVFLQTHDTVGNRAHGERLHHQVDPAAWRAASALLLCGPQTPLLFMGQEWAASTPFLYFTDHHAELGRLVSEGRRREMSAFASFASGGPVPDPQDPSTFERCRLRWEEIEAEPHAAVLRLYRALLALRRDRPLLWRPDWTGFTARPAGDGGVALRRDAGREGAVAVLVMLEGAGEIALEGDGWTVALHTEEARFCADPRPPDVAFAGEVTVLFHRPGAVVLERRPAL